MKDETHLCFGKGLCVLLVAVAEVSAMFQCPVVGADVL